MPTTSDTPAMPTAAQKRSRLVTAAAYVVAILLGIACGLWGGTLAQGFADFMSSVFVRLFKFISIPIIAVSIISTLARISQSSESGRIFRHTIFYTLTTTILAASTAAVLYVIFKPSNVSAEGAKNIANITEHSYMSYLQSVVPDNFLSPFLSANVLSVLLISAAVGIAIACMKRGSKTQEMLMTFFSALQEVLFILVKWLIAVLPLGIFGFISNFVVEMKQGVSIGGLGTYFGVVLGANFIQMLVVLPLFMLLRGVNPLRVAKGMAPALAVAFFSKSSAGTLPVTMNCSENNVGVHREVARFVLPICTTINMNGCAAFIFTTVIFLMQNAGAAITPWTMVIWIFIATLAAVGNAGVPMGCFFLSASLLASMNVPIILMGVILPIYAVIDMIETTLNVWSDSSVAAMVNADLYGRDGSERLESAES
ncbi:MAG: Dicarboxylate/amino acid:cation symporter [Burkholderia sp.]|jgi:Na+/H+-dicarboxylate symporter